MNYLVAAAAEFVKTLPYYKAFVEKNLTGNENHFQRILKRSEWYYGGERDAKETEENCFYFQVDVARNRL